MRPDRTRREHHLALSGGFTLLELGVVIAVISVLTAGVAVGGSAYLRAAYAQRTATDMGNILKAGQAVLFRNLQSDYSAANGRVRYRLYSDAFLQENVNINSPFTGGHDSPCFVVGNEGDPRFDIKSALTATQAGAVLNAYNQPFRLCANARRVEVQTCLPQADAQDYSEFRAMGDVCSTMCPAGLMCRTLGTSLVPTQSQKTITSYTRYMYAGPALAP